MPIDVVFIGSCTNGRIEDIRAAAAVAKGRHVAAGVQALVVPGSGQVKKQAEDEGLDRILLEAGFEWRDPCCSMCLGMNPDKLTPGQRCASTSNRNFEGRQGVGGRTHLVSPAMAAAAAAGRLADVATVVHRGRLSSRTTARPKGEGDADGKAMDKFTTLTAVAAPMPMQNIDTDKVIPARFLKTIKRSGLGVHLFDPLRFDSDGQGTPEFILNQEPYRHAEIIIAHENFGCGSSREHAPGRCSISAFAASSRPIFADIFYNNSFKNGLLPIRLPRAICDAADRRCEARRQRAHHHRPGTPGRGAAERRGDPLRHRPVPQALCC